MDASATDARYLVSPVLKALQVLDVVAANEAGIRLTAVSQQVQLPKPTVFRYLRTLVSADYLEHDLRQDLYRVGPRFRLLGNPAGELDRLRAAALPVMTALRAVFDETVNLGILRGRRIVYVEIVECARRLRLQAHVGGWDPVHSTALGKSILAGLAPAARQKILGAPLQSRTPRTVLEQAALEAELAEILRRGYAVERGENEEGAVCVGAAIPLVSPIAAAISLSAPETRMPERLIRKAGKHLIDAAAQIVARLDGEAPLRRARG